jgi:hypothetical protein
MSRVKSEVDIDIKPDIKPNIKSEDDGEQDPVCHISTPLLCATFDVYTDISTTSS